MTHMATALRRTAGQLRKGSENKTDSGVHPASKLPRYQSDEIWHAWEENQIYGEPTPQPTWPTGSCTRDNPGHLQMFFVHILSSFGGMRRTYSKFGGWS